MTARLRDALGSLRGRLVIGYVVTLAVVIAVWAMSLFGPLTQAAVDQQQADLVSVAKVAALAVEASSTSAAQAARAIARPDLRVTIVATDGVVLADSAQDPATMENHAARPEVAAALQGRVGSDTRRSATLGTEQVYVAVPATLDGSRVVVRVSEPLALVQGLAERGRDSGLLLLAIAVVAAVAIAVRLSRAAVAPVLQLRDAAELMAAGDLTASIPRSTGELEGLSRALETLRDRIGATVGDLTRNETALRAALDGLTDAVFLLEGDEVAFANRAANILFRAPATGWPGASLSGAGLPVSLVSAIERGGQSRAVEEIGPDPEGRYFRISVIRLADEGTSRRTLAVVDDITGRSRLDAVRRDFVANASHELKTPASTIKLLAEAAEVAASDGDEAQAMAFVTQIRAEAERLRRLVSDLLDLARLEHRPTPGSITDMRAAITNALSAHRRAAADAGLALSFDCDTVAGQDVYATADATDVAIALDNLLANAVAYTERGEVQVCLDATKDTVTVRVSDTGPGIAAEHLPRLFERFYRVDPARSRVTGGTGLGLALVRNAVEVSGGSVDVSSEVGRGTTFTLRLPRAR